MVGDTILDLLPPEPLQLPMPADSEFRMGYEAQFHKRIDPDSKARPWGAPEDASPAWVAKRRKQVTAVLTLLSRRGIAKELTLCDFSAGAGYYTLECARHFRSVIHADVSPESLVYSQSKAKRLGLDNVAFCRIDYLRPPFKRSLDFAICMDSMIRGQWHDAQLLRSITQALSSNGTAIFDFHNWWHNPLRRIGLGRDNFRGCWSYTKGGASRLIREAGLERPDYYPFRQEEPTKLGRFSNVVSLLIPPTRLVYCVRSCQDAGCL